MRIPRLPVLLLSIVAGLLGCGDGAAITVDLQLEGDPLTDVTVIRLQATFPPPMQPLEAEASRSAGEVRLPPLPFGPGRRIIVEGLDRNRFMLSRGESESFEVTPDGPERVTVRFARCTDSLSPDKDGDGFGTLIGTRKGCAPQQGWSKSADDCSDSDRDAHPGQKGFFDRVVAGTASYDFNCDGKSEPESTEVIATCEFPKCDRAGWESAPPSCGAVGTWTACTEGTAGACGTTSTSQKKQACR